MRSTCELELKKVVTTISHRALFALADADRRHPTYTYSERDGDGSGEGEQEQEGEGGEGKDTACHTRREGLIWPVPSRPRFRPQVNAGFSRPSLPPHPFNVAFVHVFLLLFSSCFCVQLTVGRRYGDDNRSSVYEPRDRRLHPLVHWLREPDFQLNTELSVTFRCASGRHRRPDRARPGRPAHPKPRKRHHLSHRLEAGENDAG
jgi:hypothetical protein